MDLEKLYSQNKTLTEAFKTVMKSNAANLNTCTLAKVSAIVTPYDDTLAYGAAKIVPVAVKESIACDYIIGYFFSPDVNVGDYILCAFTDTDFRPSISHGGKRAIDRSDVYRSQAFAVIIPLK